MRGYRLAPALIIAVLLSGLASHDSGAQNCGYYTNRFGERVPRPCGDAHTDRAPAGATAICRDGTYSFSKHHSGTCSGHGGVESWQ